MKPIDKTRMAELVGLLRDELITDAQFQELNTMLESGKEARRLYRICHQMHEHLEQGVSATTSKAKRSTISFPKQLAAIAAILIVGLSVGLLTHFTQQADDMLATVVEANDIEWESAPHNIDATLSPTTLCFKSGSLRLAFKHGVVAAIEGPADLDLHSMHEVYLRRGQIVTYVPEGAENFVVRTPQANFVDRGTEFGVRVGDDGQSVLNVFDGHVEIQSDTKPTRNVLAGMAFGVDQSGTAKAQALEEHGFDRGRRLLRESRRMSCDFSQVTDFPGTAEAGWTSPWIINTRYTQLDKTTSGLQHTNPLGPDTGAYLAAHTKPNQKPYTILSLGRRFANNRDFRIDKPYTIECQLRIDSDPNDLAIIKLLDNMERSDLDPEVDTWWCRTEKRGEQIAWRVYNGMDESRFQELPIVQGGVYRFLFEINPIRKRWRLTISDGQHTIRSQNHREMPLLIRNQPPASSGAFNIILEGRDGTELGCSIDTLRIQNQPVLRNPSRNKKK